MNRSLGEWLQRGTGGAGLKSKSAFEMGDLRGLNL